MNRSIQSIKKNVSRMKEKYHNLSPEEKKEFFLRQKEYKKLRPITYRWIAFIYNARSRNIPVSIGKACHSMLIMEPCIYCSSSPALGIDRRDSNSGYTYSNSVPCCGFCNRAKREFPVKEFEDWLDKAAEYRMSLKKKNIS